MPTWLEKQTPIENGVNRSHEDCSLNEIAAVLGMSRQRADQIIRRSARTLWRMQVRQIIGTNKRPIPRRWANAGWWRMIKETTGEDL